MQGRHIGPLRCVCTIVPVCVVTGISRLYELAFFSSSQNRWDLIALGLLAIRVGGVEYLLGVPGDPFFPGYIYQAQYSWLATKEVDVFALRSIYQRSCKKEKTDRDYKIVPKFIGNAKILL